MNVIIHMFLNSFTGELQLKGPRVKKYATRDYTHMIIEGAISLSEHLRTEIKQTLTLFEED